MFIIKARKWNELKEATGHNKHSDQFLPPAGFDQRGYDGRVEALEKKGRPLCSEIFVLERKISRYFIDAGRSWREIQL